MEQTAAGRGKKSPLREIFESLLIAVILAVIIRMFILQPFYIPSGSMEPTLQINDRIIVSKISYRLHEPERGDIVVFKFPHDTKRDFVKRLIGKGGETVAIRDSKLYINDKLVPEKYLPPGLKINEDFGPVTVPEGHYLMMGDNRNNSNDSRKWGPLPKDLIIGKAVMLYWPLQHIRIINEEK